MNETPPPSSPYDVDVAQQDASRSQMSVGKCIVGIVFGTMTAFLTFCATYVVATGSSLFRELVRQHFELSQSHARQVSFLCEITLALVVAAATFFMMFHVARNLKWR